MHTRRARAAALAAVWLLAAVPVAAHAFLTGEESVRIGAHTATTSPTVDGKATLVVGGLAPSLRVTSGLPVGLGVEVTVNGTDAGSLDTMVQRDAVIASAPEGEIARVRGALVDLAVASLLRGVAAGALAALLVAGSWALVGAERRRQLRSLAPRPIWWVTAAGTAALVALAAAAAPRSAEPEHSWSPITELVPEANLNPALSAVEVADGTATEGGVALIRGAISTYRDSVGFYDALTQRVATVARQLRGPADDDEVVALLVSDRHDNIGMDRVARAIGDAAGATILLDAGDDTASGAAWEDFSIDSLAAAFEGYEVVAAPGNHDAGGMVAEQMADAGFTVLDGEPAEVDQITFLGVPDPRTSGFGNGVVEGSVPFDDVAADLVETACGEPAVSTVLVHSPAVGLDTAESGCVDLVLSGHLHRQVGPTVVRSGDVLTTTTYTNGTTGGAAYAFALGSALRRPAQVTLVTFAHGRPRGLQPVDIETDGTITVQPYQRLELTGRRLD